MKIYTDGAASNNGKVNAIGGWGYAIISDETVIAESKGKSVGATNQQMELISAIEACKHCLTIDHPIDQVIEIHSDSAYLVNCYNQNWWLNWQRNGWRNAKKEPVANKELWEQLIPFLKNPLFSFVKVKGHSGDKWNDYVDQLAVSARTEVE